MTNFCFVVLFCLSFVQTIHASDSLTVVEIEGKFGFQNAQGELIIPAEYLSAESFNVQGLALVCQDIAGDGWPYDYGYIDKNGNVFIPLQYQFLSQFSEGFAVAQKGGNFGYLAENGEVAVDFIYSEASIFEDGKAVVKLDGETQVIDRPNWVAATLPIREVDYISFVSSGEYLDYLANAFHGFDAVNINDSDYITLERYIFSMLGKMPALEAQVSGTNIMVLSENYAGVLSASKEMYNSLMALFVNSGVTPTDAMMDQLRLMNSGIANVTSGGVTTPISPQETYYVVPFPVPYFDPAVYGTFTKNTEFSNYLVQRLDAMGGNAPNLSGSEALVSYINHIFLNLEPLHISEKFSFNTVNIGTEKHVDFFKQSYELNQQIETILSQYHVALQENASNTVLILVDGNNLENAIKFRFHKEYLMPYLEQIDGLRIVVGNQGQGLYLPSEDLIAMLETRDTLAFDVLYLDNSAVLTVYDVDGKTPVTELPGSIFMILPASSQTTTVYALLDRDTNVAENWGGVVKLNNTIEFATTYAGEYYTREARATISDIDQLSLEIQDKIHFMVSKGFFALDGTNFHPEDYMTRTELIVALVRLFFVQDTTATSDFSDVLPTDPNYSLISAAFHAGISSGFEDGTFRGDNLTTKVEVVAFLTKTLESNKGYISIEDPTEVIKVFPDYESITSWAIPNVALAIEHNLIETNEAFNGESEVTRREVAQLLYTLFANLYDVPDAMQAYGGTYTIQEGYSIPVLPLILAGVAIVLTFIGKKVKQKMDRQKEIMARMQVVKDALAADLDDYTNEQDDY